MQGTGVQFSGVSDYCLQSVKRDDGAKCLHLHCHIINYVWYALGQLSCYCS